MTDFEGIKFRLNVDGKDLGAFRSITIDEGKADVTALVEMKPFVPGEGEVVGMKIQRKPGVSDSDFFDWLQDRMALDGPMQEVKVTYVFRPWYVCWWHRLQAWFWRWRHGIKVTEIELKAAKVDVTEEDAR